MEGRDGRVEPPVTLVGPFGRGARFGLPPGPSDAGGPATVRLSEDSWVTM